MTPTPITVPTGIPPLPVFSQGMITHPSSGAHIYISGNIGCEQTSEGLKVVVGGVRAQTKAALHNIRTLLEASNSSLAHVVKANVYLTDMANFGDMNEVYATFFEQGKMPARTCIGVAALPLGAEVEIECVAEVIKVKSASE